MNYDINVREEIFGATILNLNNGNRDYITNEELDALLKEHKLPIDLNISFNRIKFTPLEDKNIKNFSFADICYLEVTRACNLKCVHCLNNSGVKLENQLEYEEFIKLIKVFSENGLQEIRFTGGEPLVHKNIYDMIKLATENGIYTSIGTNGTLITKEVAKRLKESGLKKAIISIDGMEEKHDEIRGEGNYKRTIMAIENLEEEGIEVRVNSVIMKSNIEDIINLAKKFNKEKRSLMIRRFIESGRGENLVDNVLAQKDYEYVKQALSSELSTANYINGHYLRKKTERISDRITIPFDISNGCKAGMRALIITPEGNIHLCGFLAAQDFPSIGNVRNVIDWRTFWNRKSEQNCLKELKEKLQLYNEIPGIQKTNCLAYVQNYINRGKL